MGRHLAANGITLLIVALIATLALLGWGRQQYDGPGPLAQAICVQVPSGSNMRRMSVALEEQGAITSPLVFRVGADYSGRTENLKAGNFLVPPQSSMNEIIDIITRGGRSTCGTQIVHRIGVRAQRVQVRSFNAEAGGYEDVLVFAPSADEAPEEYAEYRERGDIQYRVVMAEGVTTTDMARALESVDFLNGDVGDLPAEGMLAPDSYEVTAGSERADLLARMRRAQEQRLNAAWEARSPDLPLRNPVELLTLASIVEKETGVAEERPVIAAVFINRLNQGMRLQTDPTIIYGITRGAGLLDREIRVSDIEGVTENRLHGSIEYNTYQIDGLPPGPIANPGRAAIEAASQPISTPYLFFVADGTGGHAFAQTLDEHNRNVQAYRELLSGQGN